MTGEFYLTVKGEIIILYKLFQKTEEEGMSPNSYYEASTVLILKSDRLLNCRPTLFINIDEKILKFLANQIQLNIKRKLLHDQVEFVPECKVGITFKNQPL